MKREDLLTIVSFLFLCGICVLIGVYGCILFKFTSGLLGGEEALYTAIENFQAQSNDAFSSLALNMFIVKHRLKFLIWGASLAVVFIGCYKLEKRLGVHDYPFKEAVRIIWNKYR